MTPSDSLHLDEHLARLLAAYDQGIGDGEVEVRGPTLHLTELEVRFGHRRGEDLTNDAALQDAGQPIDVVGVKVSQDNGIHDVHAQPGQAAVDKRGVRPRVNHDRMTEATGQDQPVTLTDVTGHHPPVW